eukprot:4234220-Amphidinium_carterae.2
MSVGHSGVVSEPKKETAAVPATSGSLRGHDKGKFFSGLDTTDAVLPVYCAGMQGSYDSLSCSQQGTQPKVDLSLLA